MKITIRVRCPSAGVDQDAIYQLVTKQTGIPGLTVVDTGAGGRIFLDHGLIVATVEVRDAGDNPGPPGNGEDDLTP